LFLYNSVKLDWFVGTHICIPYSHDDNVLLTNKGTVGQGHF